MYEYEFKSKLILTATRKQHALQPFEAATMFIIYPEKLLKFSLGTEPLAVAYFL